MEALTNLEIIAGTIRHKAGSWHIIEDAKHLSLGMASVTKNGEYIQVMFKNKARRVVTFIVAEDETLSSGCFNAGASVGLDRALIKIRSCNNARIADGANLWIYGILEGDY